MTSRVSRSSRWLRSRNRSDSGTDTTNLKNLQRKAVFGRPRLEYLETRLCPSYVSIADELTFSGNFQPVGDSEVAVASTADPVQISLFNENPTSSNFQPILTLATGGKLTIPTSDPNHTFNVTGVVTSNLGGTSILPSTTALFGQQDAEQTISADNLVNSGGSFKPSNPIVFGSKETNFTIYSLYLGTDPIRNVPAIAVSCSLSVTLPGKSSTQLTMAFDADTPLYINGSSPPGFDTNGGSASISTNFTFAGVSVQVTTLTVDVSTDVTTDATTFGVSGKIKATANSPVMKSDGTTDDNFGLTVTADMGSKTSPGFEFTIGDGPFTIDNFFLNITGDLMLAGLKVQAKALTLSYDGTEFALSGGISVGFQSLTFSGALQGLSGQPGLTVDPTTGTVVFNGLALGITDFNLGVFDINAASFSFVVGNNDSGLELKIKMNVSFPGGWTVFGKIDVSYVAPPAQNSGWVLKDLTLGITAAIPIGDTDMFITYISGSLDNIGTSSWSASGTIAIAFGQEFTVKGQTVHILEALGSFSLDKDQLVLTGQVAIGAYTPAKQPVTNLNSLLGIVSTNVTLDWGSELYSVSLDGTFLDGTFTVDGSFVFNKGEITLQATAGLHVPDAIPLIGGDLVASANFVFEYQDAASTGGDPTGFFAAWVHLPIIGDVGVEVDFDGSTKLIGKNGINGILTTITNPPPVYYHHSMQFTLPDGSTSGQAGATAFSLSAQWVVTSGQSYYLTVTLPDKTIVQVNNGQPITQPSDGYVVNQLIGPNVPSGQQFEGLVVTNDGNTLAAGTSEPYILTLYTLDNIDQNNVLWGGLAGYTPILAAQGQTVASLEQGKYVVSALALDDPAFASGLVASLYVSAVVDGQPSKSGQLVAKSTTFTPGHINDSYQVVFNVDPASMGVVPGSYVFSIVFNDAFNPTSVASPSDTFQSAPPLTGTLLDVGDGRNRPLSGFTVFLDFNGDGLYESIEPSDITNALGQYAIYSNSGTSPGLVYTFTKNTNYTVGVVLPPVGYDLPSAGSIDQTFTYEGGTSTVDFQVLQQATIAGVVYEDLNHDGMQDNGEPGVAGVVVNIGSSGQATTLGDGSFEWIGGPAATTDLVTYEITYVLPAGSLASGVTELSVVVTIAPYARITTGFDSDDKMVPLTFGILQGATISGTVTSNPVSGGQLGSTPLPQPGVPISLTNQTTGFTTFTTTDASGAYSFTGVDPTAKYTVTQTPPSGFTQVSPATTNPNLSAAFLHFDGSADAVVSADFNNDGNLDMATFVNGSGIIDYFYGAGNGTFAFQGLQVKQGLPSAVIDMQTGDFNGDGYTDLICLGTDGDTAVVDVVYGSASGFASAGVTLYSELDFPELGSAVYGFAVDNMAGKWDGSNKDSFVVYGQQSIVLQQGGFQASFYSYFVDVCSAVNNFVPTRLVAGPASGEAFSQDSQLSPISPLALAIGDLNNDGNLDLFLNFSYSLGFVGEFIAYGHGDGTFGQQQQVTLQFQETAQQFEFYFPDSSFESPGNGGPVALGDLNGDKILDAVTSDFTSSSSQPASSNVYVFQQSATGTWYDATLSSGSNAGLGLNPGFPSRTLQITGLGLADINGDGQPDIVIAESPYDGDFGQVLTYFNQGTDHRDVVQFNANQGSYLFAFLADGAQPNSMALGDIDNNGQVDILLGESSYGKDAQNQNPGGVWVVTNESQIVANPVVNVQPGGNYTVNFLDLHSQFVQLGGTVFEDLDHNGQRGAAEAGVAGVTVYLDVNDNGSLDPGEPFTKTNSDGAYVFGGLDASLSGRVRLLSGLAPNEAANPSTGPLVLVSAGSGPIDFAVQKRLLFPLATAAVSPGHTLTLTANVATPLQQNGSVQPGRLVYTLGAGAPAGMTIDPGSGVLSWTPDANQAPGTYSVTVLVHNTRNPLLSDSETVQITVLTPNQSFVSNLYEALLGRAVDPSGMAYFTAGLEQGVAPFQVALAIENAPTNEAQKDEINRLYIKYLQRSAFQDQVGLSYWVGQLTSGSTIEHISASLLNSPEFIEHRTNGSFDSWLDAFYDVEFHRAVDASGRASWDHAFAGGRSRDQIALAIFTAPPLPGQSGNEYQIDLVDSYYEDFLGRSSRGDTGADTWLSDLQSGVRDEVVIAGILSSSEFFNRGPLGGAS